MSMFFEKLKYIIKEFHENGLPRNLIDRDVSLKKFLIPGVAKIITGPRRAGKTFLMFQIMKYLGKSIQNYVYIDFEDVRLKGISAEHLEDLLEAYYSLYPDKKPIFFLDEIHVVRGWEGFVRRLLNAGYEVFLTGSNSQLLSREYASKLGGRFVQLTLLPLSFKEFLKFKGVKVGKNIVYSRERFRILRLFEEYLIYGGFPAIVNLGVDAKKELLKNYYLTTIFRDVVVRHRVVEEQILELLIKKVVENITNPYSFNSIVRSLLSIGIKTNVKTLSQYYRYLEEAFFFLTSKIRRNSFLKQEMERKTYIIDNGYLSLFYVRENLDKRLENAVAVEVFRKFGNLEYLRNGGEVDFVFPKPIQVSWYLDENNRMRELKPLLSYMEKAGIWKAYIITYNQRDTLVFGGRKIEVIPLWQFALFGFP